MSSQVKIKTACLPLSLLLLYILPATTGAAAAAATERECWIRCRTQIASAKAHDEAHTPAPMTPAFAAPAVAAAAATAAAVASASQASCLSVLPVSL